MGTPLLLCCCVANMDSVLVVAGAYAVVVGGLLFIMLCGESSSFWVLRAAHGFLTRGLWRRVGGCVRSVCGNRGDAAANWLFNTNHPLLSIFYLVLVWGGVAVFVTYTLPYIPNPIVPAYHLVLIPLAIALPNVVFYLASHTPPGIVTPQNASEFAARYPYDDILFGPKHCSTCLFTRPARTKHCSLCGVCVARFDHHCAWINNCVGEQNHRLFFAFLLSTSILCAYGAYLCACVLLWIIEEQELFSRFVRGPDGNPIPVGWGIAFKFVMVYHAPIMGVGIFMGVISFVLYLFFLYHCYLIARGTSTAETFKLSDAKADLAYWTWRQNEIKNDPDRLAAAQAALASARTRSGPLPDDAGDMTDADVLSMDLPDVVTNTYNKGMIANFKAILFPPKIKNYASWPRTRHPSRPPSASGQHQRATSQNPASQPGKSKGGKKGKGGKGGKKKRKTN